MSPPPHLQVVVGGGDGEDAGEHADALGDVDVVGGADEHWGKLVTDHVDEDGGRLGGDQRGGHSLVLGTHRQLCNEHTSH